MHFKVEQNIHIQPDQNAELKEDFSKLCKHPHIYVLCKKHRYECWVAVCFLAHAEQVATYSSLSQSSTSIQNSLWHVWEGTVTLHSCVQVNISTSIRLQYKSQNTTTISLTQHAQRFKATTSFLLQGTLIFATTCTKQNESIHFHSSPSSLHFQRVHKALRWKQQMHDIVAGDCCQTKLKPIQAKAADAVWSM